jgi:hypothetical protein
MMASSVEKDQTAWKLAPPRPLFTLRFSDLEPGL